MRLLSVILVVLALLIAVGTWLSRGEVGSEAGAMLGPRTILVSGLQNSLASVARQTNDPAVFSYDPATRMAVSSATLIIEGELRLGEPDRPGSGEYLEMATQVCGDLRIEVRPAGILRLDHSTIRTVSQVLSNTACSRGYALFIDGTLEMNHSRISYLSGSTSQCLRQTAKATIRHSSFAYCDGNALSCVNVDGCRVIIENSELTCGGNWALYVQGTGGAPLVLRDTVFKASLGDVMLTGESAEVRLVDCVFDPTKIVFNNDSGRLRIEWTRRFKVVEAATGKPLSGVLVRAEPVKAGGEGGVVEGRTDTDGVVVLTLADRLVLPGPGGRTTGPPTGYRITAATAGGGQGAALPEVFVRGKDSESIVLEVR